MRPRHQLGCRKDQRFRLLGRVGLSEEGPDKGRDLCIALECTTNVVQKERKKRDSDEIDGADLSRAVTRRRRWRKIWRRRRRSTMRRNGGE